MAQPNLYNDVSSSDLPNTSSGIFSRAQTEEITPEKLENFLNKYISVPEVEKELMERDWENTKASIFSISLQQRQNLAFVLLRYEFSPAFKAYQIEELSTQLLTINDSEKMMIEANVERILAQVLSQASWIELCQELEQIYYTLENYTFLKKLLEFVVAKLEAWEENKKFPESHTLPVPARWCELIEREFTYNFKSPAGEKTTIVNYKYAVITYPWANLFLPFSDLKSTTLQEGETFEIDKPITRCISEVLINGEIVEVEKLTKFQIENEFIKPKNGFSLDEIKVSKTS